MKANSTTFVCLTVNISTHQILKNQMNSNYKVGDLIYDANIYDGMNTHIDDLLFYKRWLPKNKNACILELCCGTGRLTIPIAKKDMISAGWTILLLCLNKRK